MKRILVVDDDAMFVRLMSHHLKAMGFEVIENTSGRDVQRDIAQHDPDACLIDIVMEEKDGLETMTELVMARARAKIIAVSSNATYLNWALGIGVDTALLKPVQPAELRVALTSLGVLAH